MKYLPSLLIASVLLSTGSLYAQRPEKVAQAINQRYPDSKTEFNPNAQTINGVKLYTIDVRDPQGASMAYVTEFGDFLTAGVGTDFRKLPADVQEVRRIFTASPENVDAYVADNYLFDIKRGSENKVYRLRLDAVGRLRDVITPDEEEGAATLKVEKASADIAKRLGDLSKKQTPEGAKITEVNKDPRHLGFYTMKVTVGKQDSILTMNDAGTVFSSRTDMTLDQLPAPIRASFGKMFDSNKVVAIHRVRSEYVQFQQKTENGDVVTFRVRPDGSIIDVRTTDLTDDEKAVLSGRKPAPAGTDRQTAPRAR